MPPDFELDGALKYKVARMSEILGFTEEEIIRTALTRGLIGIGRKDVKAVTGKSGGVAIDKVYIDPEVLNWLEITSPTLPLEHLQMKPRLNRELRAEGARTIMDMITLYRKQRMQARHATPLKNLIPYVSPIGVRWFDFYEENDVELVHQVLTGAELSDIDPSYLQARVNYKWIRCSKSYEEYLSRYTLAEFIEGLKRGEFLSSPMPQDLWELVAKKMLDVRRYMKKEVPQHKIFSDLNTSQTQMMSLIDSSVEAQSQEARLQDSGTFDGGMVKVYPHDLLGTIIPVEAEDLPYKLSYFLTPAQVTMLSKLGVSSITTLRTMEFGVLLNQYSMGPGRLLKMISKIVHATRAQVEAQAQTSPDVTPETSAEKPQESS